MASCAHGNPWLCPWREQMARPLRSVLALCAPAAIAPFVVNPSAVFRSRVSHPMATTAEWPSGRTAVAGTTTTHQAGRGSRNTAPGLGPLFAKPLAFEVTHKPSVNSSVILTLDVPGETTKICYDRAIRLFSKQAGDKIPGFSGAAKHPPQVIENYFGVGEVKGEALKIMSDTVVNEAINNFDFKAIGSATLVQDAETVVQLYSPGQPLMLEVKCDIWPDVTINKEYTGLTLEVELPPVDQSRVDAAWKMLQERNILLEDTEDGYEAQLGDSVIGNMEPYHLNPDGSRGDKLPAVASGEEVDIVLEKGRYMPGLAEGLEGVKQGEKREIRVTFPDRMGTQGGDLEGKDAVFEVEAVAVKKRATPEVNDAFANSIREGLTLQELTEEVEKAVREESGTSKKDARNRAMEDTLLAFTDVEIPETLVVEEAREKFAIMMTEFKDQGESDEKIRSMITKENFEKYVEVVRKNVTRGLSASLVMTHIAEKEGLQFDPQEVDDELDQIRAQAKGQEIDEAKARDSIEARLEKNLVLDWIEERSTVTYVEGRPVALEAPAPMPSPP